MSPRHSRPDSRRPSRFHARQQGPVDCKRKSGFYLKRPCPLLASTAGRASGPGRNPGDRRALREKRVGTAPGHGGRRHVKPAPPADPPAPARGRPLWSVPPTPSHPAPLLMPRETLSSITCVVVNAACTTALAGRDPGGTPRGAPASASNCALESGASPKGAATGGGFWLSVGRWGGARFAAFPNSHGANTPVTAASRSLETRPPKPHSSPQTFTGMGPSGSQRRVIREPARGSVGWGPALRAAEAEPGLLQPGDTPRLRRQHVLYPGC